MCRLGVVVKPCASSVLVAFGIVIGDQQQHPLPAADHGLHVMSQYLAQVRPAQVEHSAEVAERHDYTGWRVGVDGEVDAPIHAFERSDRRRMLGQIALPGDTGLGTGIRCRILACMLHQPFYAEGNGFVGKGHVKTYTVFVSERQVRKSLNHFPQANLRKTAFVWAQPVGQV